MDTTVTATFVAETSRFTSNVDRMASRYDTAMRDVTRGATQAAQKSSKQLGFIGFTATSALGGSIPLAVTAGMAALKRFATGSVGAARAAIEADNRLQSVAESMGVLTTALGGTIQPLVDHATELQNITGVDDEVIKQSQALLLTFKNIADSAGKTGGAFERATAATLDLAAVGFGGAEGAAKALGKALNDPIAGVTALRRQGITFDEAQKAQIKTLVESGRMYEAQALILKEVETQVGGAAAATANAGTIMKAAFGDFQEQVGALLLPLIDKMATFMTERVIPAMSRFMNVVLGEVLPQVMAAFSEFGERVQAIAARLRELAPAIAAIVAPALAGFAAFKMYQQVPGILGAVQRSITATRAQVLLLNASMLANPVGLAIAGIAAVVAALAVAFKVAYDRSEPLRNAVGALIETVKRMAGVVMGAVTQAFNIFGGSADKTGKKTQSFSDLLDKFAKVVAPVFTVAVQVIGKYVTAFGNYLQVVFKVLEVGLKIVTMVANVLKVAFTEQVRQAVAMVQRMRDRINDFLDRLGPLGDALRGIGGNVSAAFTAVVTALRSLFSNAGGMLEGLINRAIDAINGLIRGYNQIPGVTDVAEIANVKFAASINAVSGVAEYGREHMARLGVATTETGNAATATKGKLDGLTGGLTGAGDAADGAATKGKKNADAIAAQDRAYEKLGARILSMREQVHGSAAAMGSLFDMAVGKGERFRDVLGDMVSPSAIMSAFGPGGTVGSVIDTLGEMNAAIDGMFAPFLRAGALGKKAQQELRAARDAIRGELEGLARESLRLMRAREDNSRALTAATAAYEKRVKDINTDFDAQAKAARANLKAVQQRYDEQIKAAQANLKRLQKHFADLEKAAQAAIKGIEKKYEKIIPGLEKTLREATSAYEKEQAVLDGLVKERDQFLGQIASGFRSFMNNLSGDGGDVRAQFERRLADVRRFTGNIRTLFARGLDPTLLRDLIAGGVQGGGGMAEALASASGADFDAINEAQRALASEAASFQSTVSEQMFAAGIAQQQAIVAPVLEAKRQAEEALAMATTLREQELLAAQLHLEQVLAQRDLELEAAQAFLEQLQADKDREVAIAQAALDAIEEARNKALEQAEEDYKKERETIEAEGKRIEEALTANALMIEAQMKRLQVVLPPQMNRAGIMAINGLMRGMEAMRGALRAKARSMAEEVIGEFERVFRFGSPSKVTTQMGVDIGAGFVRGMDRAQSAVGRSAAGLTGGVIPLADRRNGGGSTTINVQVTAGMGTDPTLLGEEIVRALKTYERRNGPVYVSAA